MSRRFHHDERGIAGTILVIVIAWALAAVLMLTATLVSAQSIDRHVAVITTEVSEIDDDTTSVALAADTAQIAQGIDRAARPLSGQLDQVIDAAGNIDGTVNSILATAGEINTTVKSIGATAGSINSTVDSIHGNVGAILGVVGSIHSGVEGINARAERALGIIRAVQADLANVRNQVRVGTNDDAGIRGHAESIDCGSAIVLLTGCTDA